MNPWECPRCHRINAPMTPSCFCKPDGKQEELPYRSKNSFVCSVCGHIHSSETGCVNAPKVPDYLGID